MPAKQKHKHKKLSDLKQEQHTLIVESSESKDALPAKIHTDNDEGKTEQSTVPDVISISDKENSPDEAPVNEISEHDVSMNDTPKNEPAANSISDKQWHVFGIALTRNRVLRLFRLLCIIGFFIFLGLFLNETVIQPYRSEKDIDLTRDLYHRPEEENIMIPSTAPTPLPTSAPLATEATPTPTPKNEMPSPTPDPNRDDQGRLLQFTELLEKNEDTKGWITIPDTKLDYVVVQSDKEDPEYYLFRGFDKNYSKAGTLFMDLRSSVEEPTQNLVIHGHNMVSTKEKMFHKLLDYKKNIKFYREHPLIQFDTIYHTGTWKIFAVFITPPDPAEDYFFEFRKSSFQDASEFLNFVYQIRIRSLIQVDAVDINENDQLLTLSTCSYEVNDDYRTIVVARKVREGEDISVDVEGARMNQQPYYAADYRKKYGKEIPNVADSFEEALKKGQITWYSPAKPDSNQ